jgi:hypothetical protein
MQKVKIVEQKISLQLILGLEAEINGFTQKDNQGNVIYQIPGILNQKMNAVNKYWLTKISNFLSKERKNYEDIRSKLIEKYGDEKIDSASGQTFISIDQKIKDPNFKKPKSTDFDESKDWPLIDNPKFNDFLDEQNELLNQLVDVKLPKFDIEEIFSFETEYTYPICFEFLIQDVEENFE